LELGKTFDPPATENGPGALIGIPGPFILGRPGDVPGHSRLPRTLMGRTMREATTNVRPSPEIYGYGDVSIGDGVSAAN
jgi:hypothetical protein